MKIVLLILYKNLSKVASFYRCCIGNSIQLIHDCKCITLSINIYYKIGYRIIANHVYNDKKVNVGI